ncbi:MAG TPA: hypothetical protein VE010_20345 [Thermoanaerobaculia bacterium]|nr:hypothetical protein [Thermoanaerobaculia bacterium]
MIVLIGIGVFFTVSLLSTAVALVTSNSERPRAYRSAAVWGSILLLTVIAGGGALLEELSLRRFAREEGVERGQLIMTPGPLPNDHQFTTNGREYLRKGILIPAAMTGALLLFAAFGCTVLLHFLDLRSMAVAVWLHAITAIGGVIAFSVWRLLASVEIFI